MLHLPHGILDEHGLIECRIDLHARRQGLVDAFKFLLYPVDDLHRIGTCLFADTDAHRRQTR